MENGIIFFVYKPNSHIDVAIARTLVRERLKVSNGVTRPLFVDTRHLVTVDTAARKYFAGPEADYLLSAEAFLIGSSISHYISNLAINVFLQIDRAKSTLPAKVFTNKKKALNWLECYKNLN